MRSRLQGSVMATSVPTAQQLEAWHAQLRCTFPAVQKVFNQCMSIASARLTSTEIDAYLQTAHGLSKLGRGAEPVVAFLQEWPSVVSALGNTQAQMVLHDVNALIINMQKSPNSGAIVPMLRSLAGVATQLQGTLPLQHYLQVVHELMVRTTVSIHGHHDTHESPGLVVLLEQSPYVLGVLTTTGLARWVDYGIRHYQHHPERQKKYFNLQLPDSRAVLQRERHGTLFAQCERQLTLGLRCLWRDGIDLISYGSAISKQPSLDQITAPYYDEDGMRLPDAYDDLRVGEKVISGMDRYRMAITHMAGHRRWSTPQLADNLSPMQRLTVECLEDARVDYLLLKRLPGLWPIMLALHPQPKEGACDPARKSCLRHRLIMLSRALIDPLHGYNDKNLLDCVAQFHKLLVQDLSDGTSSTAAMCDLALIYTAKTRQQSDQLADVHFDNTTVSYRDDNRSLWRFIEAGDEEEIFDQKTKKTHAEFSHSLPPHLYPEWDAATETYRPDWVTLYEALHPAHCAADVDALLERHKLLAKQLKRQLDLLKPQDRVRQRYQEEGSELDLDVALNSYVDWRAGVQPQTRILMNHKTNGRSIAVLLLLDLSESLNDLIPGTSQTRLDMSQEAVALLAWAVDSLGDPFAIAGFHSNTRHDVRYQHILGFSEKWGAPAKARLAALKAEYSTRMGAAMRHAAHYLDAQTEDKKLLLVLTDGQPADVDVSDPNALIADTRQAVKELAQQGIYSHCISLDTHADRYVHDIFGQHCTVIDHIAQLPQRMTRLFLSLTR